MNLDKAQQVAATTVWEGDMRVNFLTAYKAANALAREVQRLNDAIDDIAEAYHHACDMDFSLENGVAWLNDEASTKFAKEFPNVCQLGHFIEEKRTETL